MMFLEVLTFSLMVLVLVLKYGAVTRIVRLNQRLREAEGKCRRNEERFRARQTERQIAEREEAALMREQASLEAEVRRLEDETEAVRAKNAEILKQLFLARGRPPNEDVENM